MEESEARVEMAARFDSPADALVADRILKNPDAYRRWEAEHNRLMRAVSEQMRLPRQVVALRSTAFALVHRKAIFEYLRDRQTTGVRRHRVFALFYGIRDYSNAVLAEHGNYVRCSWSYLCTFHPAEHLMQDAAFDEPLRMYEQWYSEYFRAYCDVALAETEEEKQAIAPMDAIACFSSSVSASATSQYARKYSEYHCSYIRSGSSKAASCIRCSAGWKVHR